MTWFHPAESSKAGGGYVLDYILMNRQFCTSVLDTRVYRNTHLDSHHRLLVSKLRLKLRARCSMAQQHPRPQVDSRYLNQQQVDDFRALLSEKLATGPKSNLEEAWHTLKESVLDAQCCLPTIPETAEEDWVTDAVRDASRRKKEMWMKCQKFPEDSSLRHQYALLKAESRRCADEAREKWWEDKVVRAEELHDEAVKRGHGGSLLKDLRLLQRSQKLKADTTLYAKDGSQLHVSLTS